jgi:hypothetical protein
MADMQLLDEQEVSKRVGMSINSRPHRRVCGAIPKYVEAPEPFVSAEEAAHFLSVKKRQLLAMARRGLAGSYAVGTGTLRKVWIFRLSELAAALEQKPKPARSEKRGTIQSGSSR